MNKDKTAKTQRREESAFVSFFFAPSLRLRAFAVNVFSVCLCAILLAGCMGPTPNPHFKVGKPYTIKGKTYYPKESYDLVEEGESSWYGPGFHGKLTSNGEIYNKGDLTAAHRTIQLPSLARVTNLENGKSLIVRINDRGPYAKERIMDVSKASAEALGFRIKGMAHVRLEVLGPESIALREVAKQRKDTRGAEVAMNETGHLPEEYWQYMPAGTAPQPEQPAPPVVVAESDRIPTLSPAADTAAAATGSFIFVQTPEYASVDAAQAAAADLSTYAPTSINIVQGGNGAARYLVRLGPFNSMDNATAVQDTLNRSGVAASTVLASN